MKESVNIPLQNNSTRQKTWRVIGLVIAALISVTLAVLLNQARLLMHPSSDLYPIDTAASLRLIKKAGQVEIVNEYLGPKYVFLGQPWTFSDFLFLTEDEITLHFDESFNVIGISIDRNIDLQTKARITNSNLQVFSTKHTTLITTKDNFRLSSAKKFLTSFIFPYYDGELIVQNNGSTQRHLLNVNDEALEIRRKNSIDYPEFNISLPAESEILASYYISNNSISAPILANFVNKEERQLIDQISHEGAYIVLTEDHQGIGTYIVVPSNQYSLDELAVIGQEIINRRSLSTAEWTLTDGTMVEEIRTSPNIKSSITTDSDISFITLSGPQNETVRITRTPDFFSIANRDISLDYPVNKKEFDLQCGNSDIHSFVRPQSLTSLLYSTNETRFGFNNQLSIFTFSLVAESSKYTYLCW